MSARWPEHILVPIRPIPRTVAPLAHLTGTVCICPECRRLDRLPQRRQGVPGAVQIALPV